MPQHESKPDERYKMSSETGQAASRRGFLRKSLVAATSVPLVAEVGQGTSERLMNPQDPLLADVDAAHKQKMSSEAIQVYKVARGFLLETPAYSVRYEKSAVPSLDILREGMKVFRVPLVSGVSSIDHDERLESISAGPIEKVAPDQYVIKVRARSSLWHAHDFQWIFFPGHMEFRQRVRGTARLGRCYFISNGISGPYSNGTSPGVDANTAIFADQYFSPAVNLADEYYFTIACPQSVGILPETARSGYHPIEWTGDSAPPPLLLSFRNENSWTSVGIGAPPGSYLFNALEYTGSRYAGASFYVDYLGYRTPSEGFSLPTLALHFGYSEYETLERFVNWLDTRDFSTARKVGDIRWHHHPIFCGWGEQINQVRVHGGAPHDFCTQRNYENWLATLDARGLPVGTVIVDDKWQKHYGTFEVDEKKWPDMKGFIALQHSKNRHVLLWVPGYETEGLDQSLCVLQEGKPVAADVTNPRYEQFLRDRVRYLIQSLGVDGFKEDWIGGVTQKPNVRLHKPIIGIEFERRFQLILYDEAHRWKSDAMVETQTPNPLFRESADVLRLNDVWSGARSVMQMMRRRARIAHLAGWPLVDCDNAAATNLEEWWRYAQAQPSIGIPSLYVVTRMETTLETVPDYDWVYLAMLWRRYLEGIAVQEI
ncbi:MAG TPA: TIM-barrel domain-containing protein [Bryobacteraceae bacterium]